MADDIFNAAIKYQKLLNSQYNFIVGYKNEEFHITLTFTDYEFHHLAGLHYLNDIRYIRSTSRAKIFKKIIQGSINDNYLSKSLKYNDIIQRINNIVKLESFLDSNKIVFKFNKSADPNSVIDADFILKSNEDKINTYFCIEERLDGTYFGKSIFSRNETEKDYTKGHTLCTILYKEKIDLLTNEKQVLYTHPSYERNRFSKVEQQQSNNIKQIKFDNPTTQNILHNNLGAAAAVIPAPNPFKNLIDRLKNIFKKQDKPTEQPSLPLNTVSKTDNITDKTQSDTDIKAFSENNFSKELKLLNEARSAFANKGIQKSEYTKALISDIKSLDSEEKTEKAIKKLENLSDKLPPNEKIFIKNEIYNVRHYLIEKYQPTEKSWLETLKNAKTADKADISRERSISEKENHISKNDCIR